MEPSLIVLPWSILESWGMNPPMAALPCCYIHKPVTDIRKFQVINYLLLSLWSSHRSAFPHHCCHHSIVSKQLQFNHHLMFPCKISKCLWSIHNMSVTWSYDLHIVDMHEKWSSSSIPVCLLLLSSLCLTGSNNKYLTDIFNFHMFSLHP